MLGTLGSALPCGAMTRLFSSFALLLALSNVLASAARAEPIRPITNTILDLGGGKASPEQRLGDLWIERLTATRARRQRVDRIGAPVLLGTAAALGLASALTPDLADETRIMFAGSALLAGGAMIPAMLARPEHRARWLAGGGSAFAVAFGVAGILETQHLDCTGWCGNEKALGWLSGALVTQGLLLLPLAFVDRGPSLSELDAYAALPAQQRAVQAKKLLARIDRAERKAVAVSLSMSLVSTAVFGAGAAWVQDRDQQVPILALGGATLAIGTVTALVALLRPSRLERFAEGRVPMPFERILW